MIYNMSIFPNDPNERLAFVIAFSVGLVVLFFYSPPTTNVNAIFKFKILATAFIVIVSLLVGKIMKNRYEQQSENKIE